MRALLAVVLLVPLLAVTACQQSGAPSGAPATGPGWQRLDDLPLSKRTGPVVAWTGSEVLAVGGETGTTCPPLADCNRPNDSARDGAALDPATGRWHRIASAPRPIPAYTRGAVASGHLFVLVDRRILDYDIAADRWRTLPRAVSPWYDVTASGDRLVLVSTSDESGVRPDLVYDVRRGRWSRLPDDPIGPAFERFMVPTPRGLLMLAHQLVPNPGSQAPTLLLAALLDPESGRWRRLPDADVIGGGSVSVVGNRVVLPSLDATNGGGGGAGDYGRTVPFGGRLDLTTETWSRLPNAPKYLTGGWAVDAPGSPLLASEGWCYDDAAGTWTRVPRPPGAPERPGPAVWAGDRLVVVTGEHRLRGASAADLDRIRDRRVWSWAP